MSNFIQESNKESRIIIRELKKNDFEAIYALLTDKRVMQFLSTRQPLNGQEIQQWINNFIERQLYGYARKVVALSDNDEFIGICGVLDDSKVYDFGFYFLPSYWGKGYAFEACSILLPEAINKYGEKLFFFVEKDNLSSHKLAKRLGLKVIKEGHYLDAFGYFYSK